MVSWQILIFVVAAASGALGQTEPIPPNAALIIEEQPQNTSPQLLPRCQTVSLTSNSDLLSPAILVDKLRARGEFKNAGLSITQKDADVELFVSGRASALAASPTLFARRLTNLNTRPPSSHDLVIRALRREDGMTASATVVALGDFEGFVAAQAIDVLHQVCPAVLTTTRWRSSGHESLDGPAIEQFRAAHSLSVVSRSSRVEESALRQVLARSAGIKARGLTVVADEKDADLRLQVDRDIDSPVAWHYELLDRQFEPMLIGSVGALSEQRAAEKIIESIMGQLPDCRTEPPAAVPVTDSGHEEALSGTWRVWLLAADLGTADTKLEITIDGQHFVGRTRRGQEIFKIEASDLQDVEYSSVRNRIFELPSAEELAGAGDDPLGILIATAAAALSAPLATRQHLIDAVWRDGDSFRRVTFQVPGRDAEPLLKALRGFIRSAPRISGDASSGFSR